MPPKNLPVRPTTDFAKEGLFNILNNKIDFDGLTVLDLFCGTGNITLEFASRGAKKIISIDSHTPCLNYIKDTSKQLNFKTIFTERADVFTFLAKSHGTYDFVFADPPYDLPNIEKIYDLVIEKKLLNTDGILVIEHGKETDLSSKSCFAECRKYGNVHFSFFINKDI
jgi:16S rRNA (guanine(966)-N(2))-methyltransferase RsmD